jgi:hypothetical protein
LQAQLDSPSVAASRPVGPEERERRFKALKKRLTKPRSYPGREVDHAEFDAINGPVLSYLEEVKDDRGNQYALREPGGWLVRGMGFIPTNEGGTTTEEINRWTERDRMERAGAAGDPYRSEPLLGVATYLGSATQEGHRAGGVAPLLFA